MSVEQIKNAIRPVDGAEYYWTVPMTDYQVRNILGLLRRSQDKNNGDWFGEVIQLIIMYMQVRKIDDLESNNFGDRGIRLSDLMTGEWFRIDEKK